MEKRESRCGKEGEQECKGGEYKTREQPLSSGQGNG